MESVTWRKPTILIWQWSKQQYSLRVNFLFCWRNGTKNFLSTPLESFAVNGFEINYFDCKPVLHLNTFPTIDIRLCEVWKHLWMTNYLKGWTTMWKRELADSQHSVLYKQSFFQLFSSIRSLKKKKDWIGKWSSSSASTACYKNALGGARGIYFVDSGKGVNTVITCIYAWRRCFPLHIDHQYWISSMSTFSGI